jgi:NADPH:quinone reductase-like Zn-dependent oxidoreductase
MNYEEAAAVPYGGLIALHYLRKGKIESRENVLIYGASGAIGTAAVQLVRYFGVKVTGVCSTKNLDLVRSLGADHVVDYTQQKSSDLKQEYDLILDAVGTRKDSDFKRACKDLLSTDGKYISIDDGSPKADLPDLEFLSEVAASGKFKPVIDSIRPLEEMVEAHRYVDKGHKKGNVIITINS